MSKNEVAIVVLFILIIAVSFLLSLSSYLDVKQREDIDQLQIRIEQLEQTNDSPVTIEKGN